MQKIRAPHTDYHKLVYRAVQAAWHAGMAVMDVYGREFEVKYKDDQSPVTLADLKADEIIRTCLEETNLPVLCEEKAAKPFETRKEWTAYWLVDPLDGTKEFVSRNGEFTVNIALVEAHYPVAGVIYEPVKDVLYYSVPGVGSFRFESPALVVHAGSLELLIRQSVKLPDRETSTFTIVASRSHLSRETSGHIESVRQQQEKIIFRQLGSSTKFCAVAEGSADYYPCLRATSEWDTAAGQAIAESAGCRVTIFPSGERLAYNTKDNLRNPHFLVTRN